MLDSTGRQTYIRFLTKLPTGCGSLQDCCFMCFAVIHPANPASPQKREGSANRCELHLITNSDPQTKQPGNSRSNVARLTFLDRMISPTLYQLISDSRRGDQVRVVTWECVLPILAALSRSPSQLAAVTALRLPANGSGGCLQARGTVFFLLKWLF